MAIGFLMAGGIIPGLVTPLAAADADPYAIKPFQVAYRTAPTDPTVRWAGFPSRVGTYLPTDQYHWWRIDITNRAEVQDAFWNVEGVANLVNGDWNGSYPITPGDKKQIWRDAFMRCLNLQRYYYMGVDATYLQEDTDPTRRAGLQAAAIIEAQRTAGYTHVLTAGDMPAGFQYGSQAIFWGYRGDLGSTIYPSDINTFLSDDLNPGPGHRIDALNPNANLFAFGQVGPNPAQFTPGRPYPTIVYLSSDTTTTHQDQNASNYGSPDMATAPPPPQYDPFDYPKMYPYLGYVVIDDVGGGPLPISIEFPSAGLLLDISGVQVKVTRDGTPVAVTQIGAGSPNSWRQYLSFTAAVGQFIPGKPDGVVTITVTGLKFRNDFAYTASAKSSDIAPYLAATNPKAFQPHSFSWTYTEFDPLSVQAAPFPTPRSAITNLSTRGDIGAGANVLIAGFIITGDEPLRVAVRAQGPSLAQFGIQHPAVNPQVEIYQMGAQTTDLGGNDDWKNNANWRLVQSYALNPGDSREAVAICTLMPGNYTAIVSDSSNAGVGVGLVEVFVLDAQSQSRLMNVSTRALIGSGENVLIGGFFLQRRTTVVVRTQGPGLAVFGLGGLVAGTKLTIVRQSDHATLATNAGWNSSTAAENDRLSTDLSVYAPSDPREAAQVITLDPGAYTALVESADGNPGIGLVEVFNVN